MARHLISAGFFVALALSAAAASAVESTLDPMRPATYNAVAGSTAEGAALSAPLNELQSVISAPGRRPKALISGQWYEEGQLYAGSRILKINPANVILQAVDNSGETPRQVLTLTPGIVKTKSTSKSAAGKQSQSVRSMETK
jgi:hypothetical protein